MKKNKVLVNLMKAYMAVSTVYTSVKFMQCRGVGKEDDKRMINNAVDRISGFGIECDKIVTLDDTELSVSFNPWLHLLTNNLGCIALVVNGTTEVFTDNNFRRMSPETQKAVLAHELGHYKCGHKPGVLYQLDRLKAIVCNKVLDMELEADLYAAKLVGFKTYLKALHELSKVNGVSKKEIRLRMQYLKKHVKEHMYEG